MADSAVEPETTDADPAQSRTVQVAFIAVSIALLVVAFALVWARYPVKSADHAAQTQQQEQRQWWQPQWLRGHEYQVLYAVISIEVVLALYLWGVGPWSDVAAPSGVKKPPPAGQVPAEARAKAAAAGARTGAVPGPPKAHPPLGPPLKAPIESLVSRSPSGEGSH